MEWHIIWEYRHAILNGFLKTAWITLFSIGGSYLIGVIIACVARFPGFLPAKLAGVYSNVLRNIPVVVKLFFFYFVFQLDIVPAALLALTLHQSAYIGDVITAGFRSIPREQTEAGHALGHSYTQVFTSILVPQALRVVIPPLTSQFIEVLKNSSVVMLISVEELTFQTQRIEHETFRGFEAATAVTVIYLLSAIVISSAMNLLQRMLIRRK
jgi:polar amino acid transport system permease protein